MVLSKLLEYGNLWKKNAWLQVKIMTANAQGGGRVRSTVAYTGKLRPKKRGLF